MTEMNKYLDNILLIITHIKEMGNTHPGKISLSSFRHQKSNYHQIRLKKAISDFENFLDLVSQDKTKSSELSKLKDLKTQLIAGFNSSDYNAIEGTVSKLRPLELVFEKKAPKATMNPTSFPKDISKELNADIREMKVCYDSTAYRATVILCARILETCLHRKYYEKTGNDLLEKSPGMGLGNLIAKMRDKGIDLDPAITQQIHLVNQVRIFSVHKKKQLFTPSKEQTQAIMLYTMDIVKKLFKD